MAKLPRVTAKIFASNAAEGDIGQYGSALSGNKLLTDDIAQIQALAAYETGWRGAVLSTRNYPTLQEMNGLQKTFSQQIAYLLNNGVAEYDAATVYYAGDIVKVMENGAPALKYSVVNNNLGNSTDDADYWEYLSMGAELATLSKPGIVQPDGETITINDNGVISAQGGANTDLSNLTADGRAKFQYAPFSINSGAIDASGANATLTGSGGVPVSVDKYTIPALSSNNSSYGVCSMSPAPGVGDVYNFTNSYVTVADSVFTWTMQLADDNHIPAGAQCSFSYQSSNASYWHESIGTRTYGISGLKITFIYTDNTSETVFDNSNLTPFTNTQQASTGSGACTSPSKEVKTVQVNTYKTTTYSQGGNFRLRAEYTASSSDTLICRPCTITTADNKTKSFDADSTLDCSNKADGNYYVMKSITDGSLSLASSLTVSKTSPASPASGLWLDNSHAPLMLKNFRVIGSPVISADGIASGFSTNNYITIPDLHLENADSWTVKGSFRYTGDINSEGGGLLSVTSGNGFLVGVDRSTNNLLKFGVFLSSVPNAWDIYGASNDDTLEFTQNADYNFIVSFDGTKYYIYCINKATGAKLEKTIVTNAVIYQTPTQLGLKRTGSNAGRFQGSIDLNAFKIYVDNQLIYEAISNDVYLGDITVSGGLITAISNNPFNWNGITGSSAGMPSNRYIDLTLGASGSTYTAPADGWFNFYTIKSTAGYTLLTDNTNSFRSESRTTVNNTGCGCYLPAKKGDVITLTYDGVNSSTSWRFYYAQGN